MPSYSTIILIHLTHLEHLRLCINKEKQPGLKLDLSTEILYCVFAHNKIGVEQWKWFFFFWGVRGGGRSWSISNMASFSRGRCIYLLYNLLFLMKLLLISIDPKKIKRTIGSVLTTLNCRRQSKHPLRPHSAWQRGQWTCSVRTVTVSRDRARNILKCILLKSFFKWPQKA